MKFARRRREEVDVNLTPLIDVVFLLLIFFMVSTTFTKETRIAIELPQATGNAAQIIDKQIEITITRSGEFAVNEVTLVNDKLSTLKRAIEQISEGDTSMSLIISADSATPHQSVVTAMDAAGQLGFIHLSITTRNSGEPES